MKLKKGRSWEKQKIHRIKFPKSNSSDDSKKSPKKKKEKFSTDELNETNEIEWRRRTKKPSDNYSISRKKKTKHETDSETFIEGK